MIDTHCHLDVAAFDADRDAALQRAAAAGVDVVVVPAIRPATWDALVAFARGRDPSLRPRIAIALGVHPQVVPALTDEERRRIPRLAEEARAAGAVAIGECGLDGPTGEHEAQEALLRLHVAAAREAGLALLLHVFHAHDVATRLLRDERVGTVGGVMHSYSGGRTLVPRYLDLGLHLSFAGPVTYDNARRPVEAARAVPIERLLVETDAPDQAPVPHRGRRSEPAFVADVLAGLARVRGEHPAELARRTDENARRLLRL